jgi:F0F1-type ATP synthase membrane subunit c/vacuolar-type H+-ATPase subunit K
MLMAGKLIGGGLAIFGLAGAAVGIGLVFAAYIQGTSRNLGLKLKDTYQIFLGGLYSSYVCF